MLRRLAQRERQDFGVALLRRQDEPWTLHDGRLDPVARDFDIDWTAVAPGERQNAVDLTCCGHRIVQHGGRTVSSANTFCWLSKLRIRWWTRRWLCCSATPGAPLMTTTGRALGIGLCHRVGDLEAAYGIGDDHGAQPPAPRIGVRGETGALLVGSVDHLERTVLDLLEERENIVAGYAESMAHAFLQQPSDQIVANRPRSCVHPQIRSLKGAAAGRSEADQVGQIRVQPTSYMIRRVGRAIGITTQNA